jgi:hypothetical protein
VLEKRMLRGMLALTAGIPAKLPQTWGSKVGACENLFPSHCGILDFFATTIHGM